MALAVKRTGERRASGRAPPAAGSATGTGVANTVHDGLRRRAPGCSAASAPSRSPERGVAGRNRAAARPRRPHRGADRVVVRHRRASTPGASDPYGFQVTFFARAPTSRRITVAPSRRASCSSPRRADRPAAAAMRHDQRIARTGSASPRRAMERHRAAAARIGRSGARRRRTRAPLPDPRRCGRLRAGPDAHRDPAGAAAGEGA